MRCAFDLVTLLVFVHFPTEFMAAGHGKTRLFIYFGVVYFTTFSGVKLVLLQSELCSVFYYNVINMGLVIDILYSGFIHFPLYHKRPSSQPSSCLTLGKLYRTACIPVEFVYCSFLFSNKTSTQYPKKN